ncbi:hypothetical protein DFH05DRAFT_1531236 [Lentinula detonsa]|nr:hypothetical protein DFH05DRAFT_1531236 [Lentinula detonsa]KAJ3794000.1 hypothetical protein GGU11DRAFT_748388 [Lentinula aff. detonsa]KAJ3979510.1 hypothetical protein F5890DRAFT_1558631 [Lentinula detonsa]
MVNITPTITPGKKNHVRKSTGGKVPKKITTKSFKQTAKKTGGPAPRLPIGAPAPAPAPDPTPPVLENMLDSEFNVLFPGTSTSLPEGSAQLSSTGSLRRSERVATAKLFSQPQVTFEAAMPSEKDSLCSDMELDTNGEDGEERTNLQEHLCAGCQDGGNLLHCEGYRLVRNDPQYRCGRLVCYGPPDSRKCIELYDEALKNVVQDQKIGFGFFRRDDQSTVTSAVKMIHSVRASFFSKLELVPMAMISIALEGMATEPFSMTLIEVEGYYLATPTPCIHASLTFDFSEGKRQKYDTSFANMFAMLKQYNVKRVVVFFTTHSTPDGDLHFIPNMGGAASTSDLLEALFPAEFRTFLQPSDVDSTLFILSCGGVYVQKQSYDCFTELVRAHTFERIVAFPARDLQPLQTARWCQDFVRRILLQHESIQYALKSICNANPSVGPHTSIIIWHHFPTHPISIDVSQTLLTQKAIWCSSLLAPYGVRITEAQCPFCRCLRNGKTSFAASTDQNGQKFLVVKCTARLQPPAPGSIVSNPCKSVLIPLIGCYALTPLGSKSGIWEVLNYYWTDSEGQYSYP